MPGMFNDVSPVIAVKEGFLRSSAPARAGLAWSGLAWSGLV
jgi:hypothetical protein